MKNLLIFIFCLYSSLLSAQTNDKCSREIKRDSVFMTVAQMPEFCGGEIEMHKFINENLCVPKSEEGERLVIRATVRFIVTKTGKIENVKAIGYNKDSKLAKALINIVESMPCWVAGKNNGIPVDVYYTLPLNIRTKE
ncbi:energy transducer TonB [Dysgonomonas sp. ZJ279]|uniref:energy transducer TonB n=1 Tax=Dysgonomonas sp. ZJ279 TaxID=2709796 RepID=UPI0013EC30AA|nr:energy transducer TonB [Dysgonomonas sp. ZJ279]